MKKKREIMLLVILLAIGFAAVSTTLVLNGVIGLGESDDFKIIFTSASIDGTKRNDVIGSDKTTINYETKTLTTVDEESELVYEATNTSRNYDAEVSIECNIVDNEGNKVEGTNIYVDMTYEPNSMTLLSGETKNGKVHARLIKAVTEPMDINIKCTLDATPKERDTLGDGYVDSNELGGTLMAVYDLENYDFYTQAKNTIWNDNVRPYVTKVVFESTLKSHETKTELTFDVSENKDGSVMAYAVENGKNVTYYNEYQSTEVNHVGYDLYIQSNGKTVANENSSRLFNNFINLQEIENIEYLDTSKVTDMSWMFEGCSSLTTLDLSSFNTSKVLDMNLMFAGHSHDKPMSLTTLDLSNFDTSSVMDMSCMFAFCSNLSTLNLSSFDTSNVMNMGSMFLECSSLITLNLSNFDTHNVIGMVMVFIDCSNLTSLDLSNFDTSNVEYIGRMFEGCSSLVTLDISNFDTSKVTDNDRIFDGCKDELIVTVKDKTTQDWVLALLSGDRPAVWTTENVIIKEA